MVDYRHQLRCGEARGASALLVSIGNQDLANLQRDLLGQKRPATLPPLAVFANKKKVFGLAGQTRPRVLPGGGSLS